MSLVAYDSSGDDDDDDNNNNNNNKSDKEQEILISDTSKTLKILQQKKNKDPVKISIPSLSDFKDVDDEIEFKKNKIQPSQRGTGLFALLPPPKGARTLANFVPHVLKTQQPTLKTNNNNNNNNNEMQTKTIIKQQTHSSSVNCMKKMTDALNLLKYDSNSDNDDNDDQQSQSSSKIDFFSLNKPVSLKITPEIEAQNLYKPPSPSPSPLPLPFDDNDDDDKNKNKNKYSISTSNVINLSKDDIIMKNKADIGPKLPIPEQEYNIDNQGNVAFDEKAIEYLCGKRGIKRKAEIINSTNIIDINGEDIKPDEREWMVKALTENPIQRPVTIGTGPGGQSKKKHQITYLAHQAKAMEVELQNQWASNRIAKNQAKSKYGF